MDTPKKPCVYILALGGTIASVSADKTGEFYSSPLSHIQDAINALPVDQLCVDILCDQFMQKISHNINYDDLIKIGNKINDLVNHENIDGVVVVQGTNCIEEVAYFINLVINTKKNIVFTGAFRPANALGADGLRNLYNAILLASNTDIRNIGVTLTFNDSIVSARDACKVNPCLLNDFSTGETGKIGMIQGNKIHLFKLPYLSHTYRSKFNINHIHALTEVYVIYGYLGIVNDFVELAILKGIKGIISAGLGKGYQPQMVTESFIKASQLGVTIVRCSRSGQGIVNREPDYDDKYGFIAGDSLTPQKASILLSLSLGVTNDKAKIQEIFHSH